MLGRLSPLKVAGGVLVYGVGVGIAYELRRPRPPFPTACERCHIFNALAPEYDAQIELDEQSSGILELRKEMVARARGRVLEVGAGTGRNLAFYTNSVSELVVSDYSEPMLQVAASKVAKLRELPGAQLPQVTLAVADAGKIPLPDNLFDTVVDTFGLCSFEKPDEALREMSRCCKPGGTILLLEHGVSNWSFLSWWQAHRLNHHVSRWGCYWNRDILGIVRKSGLKITHVTKRHWGTTYVIHCKRL
ncbi:hypothetical protein AB1Y20_020771 [Prymnesium parvum]|uniref:Methyltransferase type 11 domain-containing protein n=1 Tax=Prymnesium parvum TaxID=97485 RepID=A0AB34JVL2_PRYPA